MRFVNRHGLEMAQVAVRIPARWVRVIDEIANEIGAPRQHVIAALIKIGAATQGKDKAAITRRIASEIEVLGLSGKRGWAKDRSAA